MRVARTIDDLFADDLEPRCYLARCFLFWAADPQLGGHAVWGAPERSDAEQYTAVLERGIESERTPPRLIIDFRGLVTFGAGAFEVLARYFVDNRDRIDRPAVVLRPNGPIGAMVAGFRDVVAANPDMPVVTTVAEACEQLGRPDLIAIADEVYRLRDEHGACHATVDRLRALFAGDDPPDSIDAAARALRMSPRTLQHRMKEAGSSYRRERDRARLERARQLLRAGEKVAAIALAIGFSTPQHFSTWFKRETGVTPSAWRDRQQG